MQPTRSAHAGAVALLLSVAVLLSACGQRGEATTTRQAANVSLAPSEPAPSGSEAGSDATSSSNSGEGADRSPDSSTASPSASVSASPSASVSASASASASPSASVSASAERRKPTGTLIVSLGDSYISGEAGRWAGNSNGYTNVGGNKAAAKRTDRGPQAYYDAGSSEAIRNCHRSDSAQVHLGGDWSSQNLACSGAQSRTIASNEDGDFKPGIDEDGQLRFLAKAADSPERVRAVVLSIGGNDFGFGPAMGACIQGFLMSTRLNKDLCSRNPKVTDRLTDEAIRTTANQVAGSIERIVQTMRDAGYSDSEWDLIVQNYPSPLPTSANVRLGTATRQLYGGCPFWDEDLDWFDQAVLPSVNGAVASAIGKASSATGKQIHALDVSRAFEGRRLCEKGAKLAEDTASADELRTSGERIQQVVVSAMVLNTPYDLQESLHPNYFGQLALRNCLRQSFNDGNVRSGRCLAPGDWSVTYQGDEPVMRFRPEG